jgi:hypothetical protein
MSFLAKKLGDVTVGQVAAGGLAYKYRKPLIAGSVVMSLTAAIAAIVGIAAAKNAWIEAAKRNGGLVVVVFFGVILWLVIGLGFLFGGLTFTGFWQEVAQRVQEVRAMP